MLPSPSLWNSCSSFKVQAGATSSMKLLCPPAPLCSQPSAHLQYHCPRLSGQSALSWLPFPTVSLSRAGALLGCREGAAEARAAQGGTLEEALWQWGDPSTASVERAVWEMLDKWFEATSLSLWCWLWVLLSMGGSFGRA